VAVLSIALLVAPLAARSARSALSEARPSIAMPAVHQVAVDPSPPGMSAMAVRTPVTKGGSEADGNPPANVAPDPDFLDDCSGTQYDDSSGCVAAVVQAIDNARSQEGLLQMGLPTDWSSLSPGEQLYVATNLERTIRGLPPLSEMATALDQSSAQAAVAAEDPSPPSGFPWTEWGGNWAGAVGNPLEAVYYWMYDDGEGSGNVDCTATDTSGCWGHRDNILMSMNCQPCVMGTGYDGTGYQGYPSWTELLVDTSGSPAADFTWAQVTPYLSTGLDPDDGQPNLVTDAGFQEPGLGPWCTSSGQNQTVVNSPSAGAGQDYLATNAGDAGSPSVWQDVNVAPLPGNSYDASVLLASANDVPISVTLVVWALGGTAPDEDGQTDVTVSSSSWNDFSTDVDVADPGHALLRLQLYFPSTTTTDLEVDGATLQDAALSDAAFQQGLGPWQTGSGQNRTVYSDPSSPSGDEYLETNVDGDSVGSVYQDVTNIPVDTGQTYLGSVFMRSPQDTAVQGTLVLWALGGSATELGQTNFTVDSASWTQYDTYVDVSLSGHDDLRFQVYFTTPGVNLDLTGATLEEGGVPDAEFDQPGLGPWTVSPGANRAVYSDPSAPVGNTWLQTNTAGAPSSSVYQDFSTDLVAGHSYTATMLLRSTGAPIPVSIVLWALGGSAPTEVGQTEATVGDAWASYHTVLDVADAGHTLLRLQVYLDSSSQTLALTNASLPDLAIDP